MRRVAKRRNTMRRDYLHSPRQGNNRLEQDTLQEPKMP